MSNNKLIFRPSDHTFSNVMTLQKHKKAPPVSTNTCFLPIPLCFIYSHTNISIYKIFWVRSIILEMGEVQSKMRNYDVCCSAGDDHYFKELDHDTHNQHFISCKLCERPNSNSEKTYFGSGASSGLFLEVKS